MLVMANSFQKRARALIGGKHNGRGSQSYRLPDLDIFIKPELGDRLYKAKPEIRLFILFSNSSFLVAIVSITTLSFDTYSREWPFLVAKSLRCPKATC